MKMLRRIVFSTLALLIAASVLLGAAPAALAVENDLGLTDEEQAFIDSAGTLRVGFVQDRTPVSFTGEDGSLAGISRYIFDHIQRITGLTFEYVPLPAGSVTYEYLMDQQLDLVTSVEFNKENQGARGIMMSDPYLSSRKVIVARKDLTYSYDAALTVAISSGSQTIRKALAATYPNFTPVDYDSITACFDAVNAGEADLMILNQYVVEYWLTKPSYEDLKVIPVTGLDDQLCFSAVVPFGADGQPVGEDGYTLISILDKAIAATPEDLVSNYIIQAVMENRYTYTATDFLYRYRFAFMVFTVSALLITVLVCLLVRQRIKSVKAQADAEAKSQFLSAMSHEIRTPLNGLIGLNYLMSHRLHDEQQLSRYLEQSTTTAKYLLSLVSDILDMSMLRNEEVALEFSAVSLPTLLSSVEAIVQSGMAEKHLAFRMDADLPWPAVTSDGVRIQQVLLNLLDNACKFTPEGGSVTVTVSQSAMDDGRVRTCVDVADTGKGMSEAFQKNIFDAFAQERDTVSKGNEGVGLGLSICHRLARLLDGDLTLISHPGQGSVFSFTFAAPPASPESAASAPAAPSAGLAGRILVVEDNDLNGEIMLDLLNENAYAADLAVNGAVALRMFSSSEPGTYGVILMDLLMPEMDGYAAAAAIRALDRPDARTVRIIACSASCTPEDREQAFASGMDDFLAKPVDIEALLEKLSG